MNSEKSIVTAPKKLPDVTTRLKVFEEKAAVKSGEATQYWLELKPYPPGSARSLWLFVDGAWLHLDDPNAGIQDSVQEAFCVCPERLEVRVWYSGSNIVGLVVKSK
ncbi:hypothetical protein KAI30_00035 [Candidatus Bathyarchaeota archaeon]|nr:hypothetical protein [Candidatus Bathyarchaeota archaeon]